MTLNSVTTSARVQARSPRMPSRMSRFLFFLVLITLVAFCYRRNDLAFFYRRKEATSQKDTFVVDKLVSDTPLDQASLTENSSSAEDNHNAETIGNVENTESTESTESVGQDLSASLDENDPGTHQDTDDPCKDRPQPVPIPADASRPPSLYFLHIPKTAGTLMHHLVIRYANKTNGLACQYLYDGNRFGPGDYHLSVKPPPQHSEGSIERDTIDAITARNISRKLELLKNGGCRTMRGHVTYKQREYMGQPIISLTVVRDPIERFISMYEFAMMMVKSRPGTSGWDRLLSGDMEVDFKNSSSLLHRGFYDTNGSWIHQQNIGFSFHFYGVLHQLSGMTPVFEGEGLPEQFRIANAHELAEKAKDNICSTHILGTQNDMGASLDLFFKTIAPFSNWTELEIKQAKSSSVNKNVQKKKKAGDTWSETMRTVVQRRFQHEADVHAFALRVIEYRKRLAQASE